MIPAVCCLIIALLFVAAPAMAAGTTSVTVTKYYDNNYGVAEDSETLDLTELQALSTVESVGPLYIQAGTFDYNLSVWAYTPGSMSNFGEQTGTYVRDITDLVGGMNAGDEIWVVASDGYKTYFNHTNVYAPHASQGEMILSWENDTSTVPVYENGMRLFFYTPSDLSFTNEDMRDSMASWYWRLVADKNSPFGVFPSATGLSSRTVSDLEIYPPHRYDFDTTGDTTEWAYEGSVDGLPTSATEPDDPIDDLSLIADNDLLRYLSGIDTEGEHAAHRFVFDVAEDAANIEKLDVTWIGNGTNDVTSAVQGADLYIWNGTGYEELDGEVSGDQITLTGEKTSNISNYVNSGTVTVLVVQKDESDGADESKLATNYAKLVVTHHHRNSNFTL